MSDAFLSSFSTCKRNSGHLGIWDTTWLNWTVQAPRSSGSTSWRKLCDLDLFSCHIWIRDGALSTPEAAVSGPFLVVSKALSDLCLKGLGDGSFPKNPMSPHLPLPNGAREAPCQEEGQDGGGRAAVGWGDILLRSDLNAGPAQAAFPRPLSQKHTQHFVNRRICVGWDVPVGQNGNGSRHFGRAINLKGPLNRKFL